MSELQIWKPNEFKGTDLLPMESFGVVAKQERVGFENVVESDLILPKLACLQGMSKQISEGVPGAAPGKFYMSATNEVVDGPVRTLILYHFQSRALYPDERKPEMAGLEACFSRDAEIGTRYGDCYACNHKEWREGKPKNKPPLCQLAHNFVVLTKSGPAVIRMGGTSYRPADMMVKNLRRHPSGPEFWDYPAIISSTKVTTYYTVDIKIDWKDPTPPVVRAAARRFYDELKASYDHGKLTSAEPENESNAEKSTPFDEDNVPF